MRRRRLGLCAVTFAALTMLAAGIGGIGLRADTGIALTLALVPLFGVLSLVCGIASRRP